MWRWMVAILLSSILLADDRASLSYLNELRRLAGVGPFVWSEALHKAAQRHALYLIKNGRIGHLEDRKERAFFGARPYDRAIAAGFGSRYVLENISYAEPSARASVDTLMGALYHRLAFLHPYYDTIGIATKSDPNYRWKRLYVYVMGNSALDRACKESAEPSAGWVYTNLCSGSKPLAKELFEAALFAAASKASRLILWPYPDARGIATTFAAEIPDPMPERKRKGYPISVTFNPIKNGTIEVESFLLFLGGNRVSAKLLTHRNDPNKKLRTFEYALIPLEPLEPGKRYEVVLHYREDGKAQRVKWRFQTRITPAGR